jgi:RHS repeat-associated protein
LHDHLGQRTSKFLPFDFFHYDRAGHLVGENNAQGIFIREYIWLDDMPLAFIANGTIDYIHTDHLGAPQKMTDGGQNVVWDGSASDPFMLVPLPTNVAMNLRFPGQYFDSETGLHYNGMRDYDPTLGRYIESDPIGLAGGINTYAYVDGNPLRSIDPTGLDYRSNRLFICSQDPTTCAYLPPDPSDNVCKANGADDINGMFSKSVGSSRPKNAPRGTRPIDQAGLSKDDIHSIKGQIGAGPQDYVGITPDGTVVTTDPESGTSVDHGNVSDYTH